MRPLRPLLFLLGLFILAACGQSKPEQAEFYVFGTLVQVSVAGADKAISDQAFTQLQQRFQSMHRDWHAWEPGHLTSINQTLAKGEWVAARQDILDLLQHAQEMESKTGGRFNAAIGKLVGLWGFHTSDYPVSGPAPSRSDIEQLLLANPSSNEIEIKDGSLHSDNPAVQLDFGGIAKGYAVDLACDLLRKIGVKNAIVNAGGDLRGFGLNGNRRWRVAIQNPIGGVLGGVELMDDEAVFTSGNYERFLETDEQVRYPHILDPRTGWPAQDIMSATVISDLGWRADAAATALIVAGLSEWEEVAKALDLDKVLLTDEHGQIYVTPEMLKRIEWSGSAEPVIINYQD